jgi:hypothetical protein
MRRRDFIKAIVGSAAAWPLAARAQQPRERIRRIGVLMHLAADDPEGQSRVAAFLQGLQEAGWAVGRNVNIDVRWAAGEADRYRRYAMEIVALTPDVILTSATPSIRAMQQATRTVPIVFILVPDAVGTGIVDSLSRPGGNATGFTSTELGMPVKWVGAAQRDRAQDDASGSAARCGGCHCNRLVWRRQGRGAIVRSRDKPHWCRERGRNRARYHRIRARAEWRPHRAAGPADGGASQFDHRARGPASASSRL